MVAPALPGGLNAAELRAVEEIGAVEEIRRDPEAESEGKQLCSRKENSQLGQFVTSS